MSVSGGVETCALNLVRELPRSLIESRVYFTGEALTDRALMTKEMRDSLAMEKAQKRSFKECDIRIRFPDGMQVQGSFGAQETLRDLYEFVRGMMKDGRLAFSLSKSPLPRSLFSLLLFEVNFLENHVESISIELLGLTSLSCLR